MKQPHGNRPLVYALYANAFFLFAILLVLLSRGGSGLPAAMGAPATPGPIAGGNGVYVMPAQFLMNVWGCYVLDTEKQTLCSYAFYGNSNHPELRLIAARGIAQDRQLSNFNTGPDPEDIKKLVQLGQQPTRGIRPSVPNNGTEKPEPDKQSNDKQP